MAFHQMHIPPNLGVPLTEEQKQAIIAVAGRHRDDASMDLWMEEIEKYRELLHQEEIARQEEEERERVATS